MSAYNFSNNIRREALAIRIAVSKFDPAKLPTAEHRELAELLSGDLPNHVITMLNMHLIDAQRVSASGNVSPAAAPRDGRPTARSLIGIKEVSPVEEIFMSLGLNRDAIAISGFNSVAAIRASLGKVKDVSALLVAVKWELNNAPDFKSSVTYDYTLKEALERNHHKHGVSPFQMHSIVNRFKGTIPFGENGYKLRKARGPKDIAAIAAMTASDFESISPLNYDRYKGKPPEETVKYRRYAAEAAVKAGTTYVILNEKGETCGTVGYMPTNTKGTSAELSWFIVPEHRRKGLATEAAATLVKKLIDNGFEDFAAHCMVSNHASKSVMRKLGFVERDDHVATGSEFDWVDMTVSKERFLELREQAVSSPSL